MVVAAASAIVKMKGGASGESCKGAMAELSGGFEGTLVRDGRELELGLGYATAGSRARQAF